ncbi:hypothetical protein CR513_56545, partial [Mucuna pruriens]
MGPAGSILTDSWRSADTQPFKLSRQDISLISGGRIDDVTSIFAFVSSPCLLSRLFSNASSFLLTFALQLFAKTDSFSDRFDDFIGFPQYSPLRWNPQVTFSPFSFSPLTSWPPNLVFSLILILASSSFPRGGEVSRDLPGTPNQEAQPSSSAAPVDGASSRDDDSSLSSDSCESYPFRVTFHDDRSDNLANGAYSWVDPEVLKVSSILTKSSSLLGMASAICRPQTWSVTVTACRSREAVCMSFAEVSKPFFYLYDTLHSKLGIQLPFTHFERSVLQALNVAPTQLHPNSWAFVRAFELLCEDLGKAPTLGVFFWFFTPRKMDRVG